MSKAASIVTDAPSQGKPAGPQAKALNYDRVDIALAIGFVLALGASAFELKTLTGLPAHPLLLHIPVIFAPLLGIAAIAFTVKPEWRKRYGIAYAIGALATMAGTGMAAAAGEAFKESSDQAREGLRAAGAALVAGGPESAEAKAIQRHADLGGAARVVVFALVVAIMIQIAIDRNVVPAIAKRFANARAPLAVALSALTIVLAAGAAGVVTAAGHAGAKVTFGQEGRPGGDAADRQGDRDFSQPPGVPVRDDD